MHEFALAVDIGRRVDAAARLAGRRLARLEVEVGALDRLDADTLAFWLAEALGNAAAVRVSKADLTLSCLACGHACSLAPDAGGWPALAEVLHRCPACRSDRVTLDGRAGCRIVSLRFEEPEPVAGRPAAARGR